MVTILLGIIFAACLYGYVLNIIKIFTTLNEPRGNAANLFILARCVGIFIPIFGVILGFF